METKEVKTVNALKHTIHTKDIEGNILDIFISLDDDCHNGHNDFSITASAYKTEKRTDRGFLYGGCSHKEILKVRPDLKIFVDLHLSDFRGVPMYAVGNGFFHLQEGAKCAQTYVRARDNEFEILKTAKDKDYYSHLLAKLGIVERWQREANIAIGMLERLTGEKFEDNSTRLPPCPVFDQEVEDKIKNGYYSPEKIQEREDEKDNRRKLKIENELIAERDKAILKATIEYNVDIAIHRAGLSLDNFIYYNHNNEGVFNWLDYKPLITQNQFDGFLDWINLTKPELPEGITFKLGSKGK